MYVKIKKCQKKRKMKNLLKRCPSDTYCRYQHETTKSLLDRNQQQHEKYVAARQSLHYNDAVSLHHSYRIYIWSHTQKTISPHYILKSQTDPFTFSLSLNRLLPTWTSTQMCIIQRRIIRINLNIIKLGFKWIIPKCRDRHMRMSTHQKSQRTPIIRRS